MESLIRGGKEAKMKDGSFIIMQWKEQILSIEFVKYDIFKPTYLFVQKMSCPERACRILDYQRLYVSVCHGLLPVTIKKETLRGLRLS